VSRFGRYAERYLARHFHAVRLARSPRPDPVAARGRPLVVYLNHAAWWDPLLCLLLAARLFPDRRHYAPVETVAPDGRRFFARLGFFALEPGTARGARRSLELAQQALQQPGAVLWVTAGERCCDPRERPVRLRSGVGHLARRTHGAVLLPLAVEYSFWEDRLPEVLARFGEEISTAEAGMRAADWTTVLAARLEAAQDALAAAATARDAAQFEVVLAGGSGADGTWNRLRERWRRERPPQPEQA
jgi:1-acyl-sn-glycerol-3-phosphate acyltransferase